MILTALSPLICTTLTDPRQAARNIMAMDLGRDVAWTALALVAAVNTFVLQIMIRTAPAEIQAHFPSYFDAPLAVFMVMAGVMVIYIHTVYWAGLMLSGKGKLDDVLCLMVWLQVLRSGAQVLILAVSAALSALAGLLSLVAFAWGLWILFNFLTEAMQLPSLAHAVIALVMAVAGLVLGLGFLLAMIGLLAQWSMSNV